MANSSFRLNASAGVFALILNSIILSKSNGIFLAEGNDRFYFSLKIMDELTSIIYNLCNPN